MKYNARQFFQTLALGCALLGAAAHAHEAVDKTRLPIGDGKRALEAKNGYAWTCYQNPSAGGAQASGAWMNGDGTFNFTNKPIVEGSVAWPSEFKVELQGEQRVITANDLPSHTTGAYPVARDSEAYKYDRNPNTIRARDFRLVLPANPVLDKPSCLNGGPIGMLISGAAIFNAMDAPGRDAVAHEIQDACQGHPERDGSYHYHNLTTCVEGDKKATQHSELLGYALDGFGIFGHYGDGGIELTNADLDECHGHTHEVDWDGKKVSLYHYHATWEFPYTLGCFRGKPQKMAGLR
jgi:hypothetical protein